MRITAIIAAVVCAGTMVLMGAEVAHAQTGVSQSTEINTSDAAIKLLQPVDGNSGMAAELAKNGVDTSAAADIAIPNAQPVPTAPKVSVFAAEGGPLRIFNCSGGAIKVKTYNSNDSVVLVAYEEKSIGNGSAGGLKCATSSCKVRIGSGNVYSALSGPQVLLSGKKLQATNTAAISKGCGAYQ